MAKRIIIISVLIIFGSQVYCFADLNLFSVKVSSEPVIDGKGQDPIWAKAQEIVTHDKVADLDIAIKSVHTNEKIFFLVRFNDPDQSIIHKQWHWNQNQEMYEIGPEREDCVVLKWAMDKKVSNLSLSTEQPYTADIWFWKANRTNPQGYADDKVHYLSANRAAKAKELKSKTGNPMFLRRRGDKGKPTYQSKLYADYAGDTIAQYVHQDPTGSRADVTAKGVWFENEWSIEFSRSLITNNDDDVQFNLSKTYLFGVSRYEIAGLEPNPKTSQPLYGAGDVSEKLFLNFYVK